MALITIPSYVEVDTQHCGTVRCRKGNSLSDVYGSYSSAKAAAWEHCESLCRELGGYNLCVTSANTRAFTAQFEFDNPENGRPMVCHITPSRTYAMYLDMRHVETAREAWTRYAELYSAARYTSEEWSSYDGRSYVIWVGGYAYIVADDEVYRVIDPYKRAGGLRKRVELQRVGNVDDEVINCLMQRGTHHVVCGTVLPCLVKLDGEHNRCIVYAQLIEDELFVHYGGWDAIMIDRCNLACSVAMCVDACMMMHGHDASGMRVRLME